MRAIIKLQLASNGCVTKIKTLSVCRSVFRCACGTKTFVRERVGIHNDH
jgi:hypothetical protein